MWAKRLAVGLWVALALVCLAPLCAGAQELSQIYEKSGAGELYDSLDGETQDLLSQAGAEDGLWEGEDGQALLDTFSTLLREKLAAPLKGLAALLGVVILCRLAGCFEEGGEFSLLAGTLACAAILTTPLLELIQAAEQVVESACVFLGASVPVYSALLVASGSAAAGGSYGFLTLLAGSVIPVVSAALLMPLLHMFLMLSLATSLCGAKFDRLLASLYSFAKWLLVLTVTVFTGILSVQTVLNAQADAATGKTVKLLASSAIPIVGGAFGDAVAAIQSSVQIVKSGVGAFGILAAICIFAPSMVQASLWMGVCLLGQVAADLFDTPRLGSLFGACASVARMVLAVLVSVCAVAVVCAALVLFVKGSL